MSYGLDCGLVLKNLYSLLILKLYILLHDSQELKNIQIFNVMACFVGRYKIEYSTYNIFLLHYIFIMLECGILLVDLIYAVL